METRAARQSLRQTKDVANVQALARKYSRGAVEKLAKLMEEATALLNSEVNDSRPCRTFD